MKLLCVVDYQPRYWASLNLTLSRNIKQLIKKYKNQGLPIIIVKFDSGGFKWLNNILKDYSNKIEVDKWDVDSSPNIIKELDKKQIIPSLIEVIGVNHSVCVYSTAQGLANRQIKTKVLRQATNDLRNGYNVFSSLVHINDYDLIF